MAFNAEQKAIANKLISLLERHKFYYDIEDLSMYVGSNHGLELTKKAYGDSYENYTSEEFMDDYKELLYLAKKLNIKIPDVVWYD